MVRTFCILTLLRPIYIEINEEEYLKTTLMDLCIKALKIRFPHDTITENVLNNYSVSIKYNDTKAMNMSSNDLYDNISKYVNIQRIIINYN